jgi:cytochrome b561
MLVWLRLAWRLMFPPPPWLEGMSSAMKFAAHAGHWALYALMVVIPLTGWLMSSAKGFQTVWFGVLPLPDLLAKDKALGEQLAQLHWALNVGLLLLIAGHAGAALWHHLVQKDDTLRRMLHAR